MGWCESGLVWCSDSAGISVEAASGSSGGGSKVVKFWGSGLVQGVRRLTWTVCFVRFWRCWMRTTTSVLNSKILQGSSYYYFLPLLLTPTSYSLDTSYCVMVWTGPCGCLDWAMAMCGLAPGNVWTGPWRIKPSAPLLVQTSTSATVAARGDRWGDYSSLAQWARYE